MFQTRSRHKGTPHSVPASSSGSGSPASPLSSITTSGSASPGTPSRGDGSKKRHRGKPKSPQNGEKGCRFWSWICCGLLCSFLSIEYSVRGHGKVVVVPATASTTTNTLFAGDAILTPLKSFTTGSLGDGNAQAKQLPSSYNQGYRYDSLASVKPDPNQHAILIPYRDRSFHLQLFLEYMGPYLQFHFPHARFTLWVIEQDDQELFNRAWLANVGLREIVKHAPETSCVVFHDVDLVPNMTSHVPYTTCQYPTQLGSELQHFNWSVPYPAYCGGITTLSLKHWQLINGLGNDYIGWGGEDDDLYHRLRQNGLLVTPGGNKDAAPIPRRPPKGHGVFRTISQRAEHHEQKKSHNNYWKTLELLREMHENSDRWKFDGMSDAYYTVTSAKTTHPPLGISQYKHVKAMPQKLRDGSLQFTTATNDHVEAGGGGKPLAPLEFLHVPYTGGQAITKAAAKSGFVWGACHFGAFQEWDCPPHASGDFQHAPMEFKASFYQAQRPWHVPLMKFLENPMEGTKRFTVVRHPYSRAISFYRYTYDQQHGYPHGFKYHAMVDNPNHPPLAVANYLRDREHPAKLNAFLQEFLIRAHHPHVPDGVDLIPQVNFVYYRGLKYVHHVLHYEFLQRDFKNILEKYDLVDAITLPPPERKRKRKKQYVKKYEEKRVPKVTWTFWELFSQPIRQALGWSEPAPPVVDMSLTEIEDEYLLGAQDLAEETIAMLNTHFENDFKKFRYAKIKVNATSDRFWNPIQIIPRESAVAKQQQDRNAMLNKQKVAKPVQTVAQAAPKAPAQPQAEGQAPKEKSASQANADTKKTEGEAPPPPPAANTRNSKEEEEPKHDNPKEKDPLFRDRKKKLEQRLSARMADQALAAARGGDAAKSKMNLGMQQNLRAMNDLRNMRAISDKLRDKGDPRDLTMGLD